MGISTPPTVQQSTNRDTAVPGICKELIGQSVSRLRNSSGTEESMADRLISDLNLIYKTVQTISDLYNGLDDDSQDNGESQKYKWRKRFLKKSFFCVIIIIIIISFVVFVGNLAAQTELLKATIAVESAVLVTMQWLSGVKPFSGLLYIVAEELKSQVKKMGGFFQMLIQVIKQKGAQNKRYVILDICLILIPCKSQKEWEI